MIIKYLIMSENFCELNTAIVSARMSPSRTVRTNRRFRSCYSGMSLKLKLNPYCIRVCMYV